jgi:transcriptional regulator with GAF, ATPase, and Fis domain
VVPALRERREDIPLLIWHCIQTRQRAIGRRIEQIPKTVDERARGVRLAAQRAAAAERDRPGTDPRERPGAAAGRGLRGRLRAPGREDRPAPENLRETERAHIVGILERCGWTIEGSGQAAERLGRRPSTLRNPGRFTDNAGGQSRQAVPVA